MSATSELPAKLGKNVIGRVRALALFFVLVPISAYWGDDIWKFIEGKSLEDLDVLKEIIKAGLGVIIWFVLLFLSLSRLVSLHYMLDPLLFGALKKVNEMIDTGLIKLAENLCPKKVASMKNNKSQLRSLFYHFVNQQDHLRAIAFAYWESYFVSLYAIVLGSLSVIATFLLSTLPGGVPVFEDVALVMCIVIILLKVAIDSTLIPKCLNHAEIQIDEIAASQPTEFVKQVNNRFP